MVNGDWLLVVGCWLLANNQQQKTNKTLIVAGQKPKL
jgi:hypothetical protein